MTRKRTYNDEGDVKKHVKEILDTYKPLLHWDMPPASQYGVSGRHDFLVWQLTTGWTIETKFGDNKPTPNQVRFANKVQKAGGLCLLINEENIWEVQLAADFIAATGILPVWMNHDFDAAAESKRKRNVRRHV